MSFSSYNSSSIKILKDLEAVRKRPGMYIGDTCDGTGLHHMAFEVIDNSIDECLAGFCKKIFVTLHEDNSLSVLDDGRGIPTDIHSDTGISSAELIMTVLHSGGKFDNNSYKISGGLHGVGISVVNALSKKLELKIYRENKIFYQIYRFGVPEKNICIIGNTKLNGTYIRFWPDIKIFSNFNKFKFSIFFNKLNELSFLNPGLYIKLVDIKNNFCNEFLNYGGIKSFLTYLIKSKPILHKNIFYLKKKKNKIYLELVLQWTNTIKSKILCFTNNIYQKDGGTHLTGLKSGITRSINTYINKNILRKKNKFNIIGEDIRIGLFGIISIKMFNPKFSSQTKEKLISSEVKYVIESSINKYLLNFLIDYSYDAKLIINKIINSYKIRESIKKSRELSRKKNISDIGIIASKLADCQEKKPSLSEIFLVEGDSAGGSAKQGRNRINQAVLPLKGKILNVEKTSLDKILSSKEINILISVLGCGIGNKNFNLDKLRYHNIIIMTDADVDGAHIRTLLLTFFYRYMPDLIKNGYLYVARPPLYKIKKGKEELYIKNDSDLLKYKIKLSFKNIVLYKYDGSILLQNKKLIYLSYKYIYFISSIFDLKNKFIYIILNEIIFFKKLSNFTKDNINLWLDNFIYYLNKKLILKEKIFFKFIFNQNISFKIKFYFLDEFNTPIMYIDNFFFKEVYYFLLYLSKEIYYFKEDYYKYIILNNKKIYFNNFGLLINYLLEKNKKQILVQRYKGLGEMNPVQLWDSTMNPKKRILSKVIIDNNIKVDKLFKILMGDNIKLRKKFIEKNFINNLNINF